MSQPTDEILTSDFDPMTPEFTADQIGALRELQGRCPVAHSSQFGGFWALTKRADIVEAVTNHKQLLNEPQHIVPGGLAGNSRPLMHSDQPEHTLYREPVLDVLYSKDLKARVVESVRARAKEIIAELVERGEGDLVTDYADPLMGHTIVSIFGIDDVSGDEFDQIVRSYVVAGQVRDGEAMRAANKKMEDIAWKLIEDRTENPRDPESDLATALVQGYQAGRFPDKNKVMGALRQPFVVVWLATSHTLSNIFRRLVHDLELQKALRAQPGLVAESVDEFLRMDQPQLGFARTPTVDVEFGGRTIPAGEPIALVFPVANRDPDVFEDPDVFKIGRYPNPHLAFGAGIHSCPGKNIAREIVEVAIYEAITGTGDFTLTIAESEVPNEHWPFHASLSLPVSVKQP